MNIGLIIVLNYQQEQFPSGRLIDLFRKEHNIQFCLLNRNNKEFILDQLSFITDSCDTVNIVNIRKNQDNNLAVRAGVRFMQSAFNLNFLGYIVDDQDNDFLSELEVFILHQEEIVSMHLASVRSKRIKPTFLQKLLSIQVFLKNHQLEQFRP